MSKQLYTVGFLFDRDEKNVLLVHKTRPKWQAGKWNGIGGKTEVNESARECMIREFEEEAGLRIENWYEFMCLNGSESNGNKFEISFFYAYDDNLNDARSVTDEIIAIHAVDNLPNVVPNLHWLIPMALTMKDYNNVKRFDITERKEVTND
jgi:8-oxo-dGTP diphosphatase